MGARNSYRIAQAYLLAVAARAALEPACDVLVAGGSLASLAAAVAAANASLALAPAAPASVCLLEITDWLGGQVSASGTSAIDFGETSTNFPANFPAPFAAFLTSPPLGPPGENPGGCTVSAKCFLPATFVAWADALVASLPNLRVYRSTAVVNVTRDADAAGRTGRAAAGPPGRSSAAPPERIARIASVSAVRRTPTAAHPSGYDRVLSESLADWYSPAPSAFFDKELLEFAVPPAGVVVEATEFGDVLLLGGLNVTQGAEVDEASALNVMQSCGQAATVCFWTSWDSTPVPSPDPWPAGWPGRFPMSNTSRWELASLAHTLTWRRSLAANASDTATVREGDVSLINDGEGGNDELNAYLFLPVDEARATATLGVYAGGVDLVALAMAEARAYAFYHAVADAAPRLLPASAGLFGLNASAAGTPTGLAKMPYLRDSRRAAAGIFAFRLCHDFAMPDAPGPGPAGCYNGGGEEGEGVVELPTERGGPTGYHWHDTVALGSYGFDQHRLANSTCVLPQYLQYGGLPGPSLPYFLPWRALTTADAPNLLVAGKNMAQSFYANAVTRLHPSEWSSGAAAGAGAALMAHSAWTSMDVYSNISALRALVNSSAVGLPIEWTL
jgi:hypothetical protein